MPEQLNPELKALRDRCAAFAREHMLPLAEPITATQLKKSELHRNKPDCSA